MRKQTSDFFSLLMMPSTLIVMHFLRMLLSFISQPTMQGSWAKSIQFRLKNLRKRKGDGTSRVAAKLDQEAKATASEDDGSNTRKKIKCQWESLPHLPDGETTDTCRDHQKKMVKEMVKPVNRNLVLIKELMDITYPFRRRCILTEPTPVNSLLKDYPALQLPTEVCMCSF